MCVYDKYIYLNFKKINTFDIYNLYINEYNERILIRVMIQYL